MNTLFDHSTAADVARLTIIDGLPYLLDSAFVAFVPYSDPAAVRWAAKKYLGAETPNGEPLWKPAKLQGSRRNTVQVALNERQAVFLAHRAALRYDKPMAIARISAAFSGYRAHLDAGVPLIPRGGIDASAVDTRLMAVIEAIKAEATTIGELQIERTKIADRIREAEERRDALAAKLPPFLKFVADAPAA